MKKGDNPFMDDLCKSFELLHNDNDVLFLILFKRVDKPHWGTTVL